MLPRNVDRGFFVKFWLNNEYQLAWKELAATGKAESASAEFWNLMAESARLLGLIIEAREANLRASEGRLVTMTIPEAEALVLFEFLSRESKRMAVGQPPGFVIEHPAEQHALWFLLATFEAHLPDPFASFYQEALTRARNEVVEKWGGEEVGDTV